MTLADLEAFFIKNFPHLCGPDTLLDKVKRLVDSATIGPEGINQLIKYSNIKDYLN
jgi:hypothetical protein